MTEWRPEVVRIEKIEKHPNADALDIATVLGDYPVIVKRDEYKVGDLASYIPIDSIVPDTNQFHFLSPRQTEKYIEGDEIKVRYIGPKYEAGSVPEKYRVIYAKKIRGIYSMGMLVKDTFGLNVGDSVVEVLSLKKFEEEEEENIPGQKQAKLRGKNAEKAPTDFSIPYYDIDGLRKYVACLRPDEEIILSEKLHGSNASFCHDGNRLWVKSRKYYKKFDTDDSWWDVAIFLNLEEKLKKYPNLAFFGELYGAVKGFRYDCEIINGELRTNVRFFDIYNVKTMRYLDYDAFCKIIDDLGLQRVPELYRGPWKEKEEMYKFAEGKTTLGGKHIREGFVLRSVKERFEPKLNSRLLVKLIGQDYSLNKGKS